MTGLLLRYNNGFRKKTADCYNNILTISALKRCKIGDRRKLRGSITLVNCVYHLARDIDCRKCIYLFTYLLTHSIEQSPSWAADRFSVSQEIPRILWNPNVHYRIHKCPPPFPILNPAYTYIHIYVYLCIFFCIHYPIAKFTLLAPAT